MRNTELRMSISFWCHWSSRGNGIGSRFVVELLEVKEGMREDKTKELVRSVPGKPAGNG